MFEIFEEMNDSINQPTDAISQISERLGARKEGESDEDFRGRLLMSDPRTRETGLYIIQKTSIIREVAYWTRSIRPESSMIGSWRFMGTARVVIIKEKSTNDYKVIKKIDLYEKK